MKIPDYIESVGMLREWLKVREYDGLYCADADECGCDIGDLMPCGEGFNLCEPAYKIGDLTMPIALIREKLNALPDLEAAVVALQCRNNGIMWDHETIANQSIEIKGTDRPCTCPVCQAKTALAKFRGQG